VGGSQYCTNLHSSGKAALPAGGLDSFFPGTVSTYSLAYHDDSTRYLREGKSHFPGLWDSGGG
jgi:hypothetical protein